jgi:predicted dinucleotide-binding enzyme
MPEYQAYVIGPHGHIFKRVELVCADDEAAKEHAKALVDGHGVVWQEGRRITEF